MCTAHSFSDTIALDPAYNVRHEIVKSSFVGFAVTDQEVDGLTHYVTEEVSNRIAAIISLRIIECAGYSGTSPCSHDGEVVGSCHMVGTTFDPQRRSALFFIDAGAEFSFSS